MSAPITPRGNGDTVPPPPGLVTDPRILSAATAAAARAAAATAGVARLQPGLRGLLTALTHQLNRRSHPVRPVDTAGVIVRAEPQGLAIELSIALARQHNACVVAGQVQQAIALAVHSETGLPVTEVHIHITDIEL